MQVIKSVVAMQRLSGRWRREGERIGFVPTMGYLHEGHLSLVRCARRVAGAGCKIVLSIYVNPIQFGPHEDFRRYPRDFRRDLILCRREGVDAVFAPTDAGMYPGGAKAPASTFVVEEQLSRGMEGASRPGHFRGVTTVVAKLLHMVQPHVAVFGAKDYQQASVIRRMIRDLNFPVRVVTSPTQREPDGLAMSSRNRNLEGDLRVQAVVLWRAMQRARSAVRASGTVSAARLGARIKGWIEESPAARLDYVAFFDPRTLVPVARVTRGTHLALAAFIGRTRLIDNSLL
jgi:pantoate--beta-alanine ligase